MIELETRDLSREQVCYIWQEAYGCLPEGQLMSFLRVPTKTGTVE